MIRSTSRRTLPANFSGSSLSNSTISDRLGGLVDPAMEPTDRRRARLINRRSNRSQTKVEIGMQAIWDKTRRIRQADEREHDDALGGRQGDRPEHRLEDQCQRALGAATSRAEVDALVTRGPAKSIAGPIAGHGRHQPGQPLPALPINVLQLANDQVRERRRLLVKRRATA